MTTLPDWLASALRPHPFRGKLRLLDGLVPRHGQRTARVFRSRMDLDLMDEIQRLIYLGTYEPKETALVRRWLKPGMTFVDVGANVGYFTALAADCVGPEGLVYAIEPQPEVHKQLEGMVEENALCNVCVICGGLSDTPGELPLYLPADPATGHNATMTAHPAAHRISVSVETLDQCMDEWGIYRIDLLKIDVEGHEPQVLRGARRALAERRIQAVLCEFNDFWLRVAGSSAQDLYRTFTEAGFEDIQGEPRFNGAIQNRFLRLKT